MFKLPGIPTFINNLPIDGAPFNMARMNLPPLRQFLSTVAVMALVLMLNHLYGNGIDQAALRVHTWRTGSAIWPFIGL